MLRLRTANPQTLKRKSKTKLAENETGSDSESVSEYENSKCETSSKSKSECHCSRSSNTPELVRARASLGRISPSPPKQERTEPGSLQAAPQHLIREVIRLQDAINALQGPLQAVVDALQGPYTSKKQKEEESKKSPESMDMDKPNIEELWPLVLRELVEKNNDICYIIQARLLN
jgi:hypothetical protein